MARTVQCVKLGRELPGLERPPYRNALGQRIFESVSSEAWGLWLEHFKLVMNEYRLNPLDPRAIEVLYAEAERFFFGDGSAAPPEFVAGPGDPP